MKILSLNIRHGGGTRILPIARYICAWHPDVVVLSEFRENKNAKLLREHLNQEGLSFFAAASVAHNQNSVCIVSRTSFVASTYPELGPEHGHRVISAHFTNLSLYGVYFPQQRAKSAVFEFLLQGPPSGDPTALFIGDFNTGRHYVDEVGATFHCSQLFEALSCEPYIDCWRSRNPDIKEFTWYSSAGNGFRIDHAFATIEINRRISSIRYDQTPLTSSITDHAALLVEYGS